jgi:hypothetical protein
LKRAGSTGLPSRSATAKASVGSPATSGSKRRMTPAFSSGRLLAAAIAPICSRFSSPPRTFVPPLPSVSLVASTTPPTSAIES